MRGELYRRIRKAIGPRPDYLFLVHQLRRGGAELELLHHIRALRELKPKLRIAIMKFEVSDPEWLMHLPADVPVVDFGRLCFPVLDRDEQLELLKKILFELRPKNLHLRHARLAWDICYRDGERLARFTKIFASVYCIDRNSRNEPNSYIYYYLPKCAPYITKIFSDNLAIKKHLEETHGIGNITALHFPTLVQPTKRNRKREAKMKVLWASRIAQQKNIPLLLLLADLLPQYEFHMYGELSYPLRNFRRELRKRKNLVWHGHFDGIDSIPVNEYDVFLYTSLWDGMPNILLEAGMKGIPIVSASSGGIPELITAENGYLAGSVAEFVKHLRRVEAKPAEARKKAERLRKRIQLRHSFAQYARAIRTEQGRFL